MAELQRLLKFLLTYPPTTLLKHVESIVASNTPCEKGELPVHQNPWLYMDATSTILLTANGRCYTMAAEPSQATYARVRCCCRR